MSLYNQIIDYNPLSWFGQKLFNHSNLLTNLSKYFRSLFVNTTSFKAQKILFSIGLAFMTYKVVLFMRQQYNFWKFIPEHKRNERNYSPDKLKQRYGNCYVLISGAADGIGLAYSKQFAKMGFNLIMADIQQEKLLFRKKQIQQMHPNIKIQSFVVDMSNESKRSEFIKNVDKFDVGIVINNVGLTGGGLFLQVDPKLMKKMFAVNFSAMYQINKHFVPKLRMRQKRSAIINMSSGTGVYISHFVGSYSSIKKAVDIYSRTLAEQNKDKIDILSVRPFGVRTGMLKMKNKQRTITPKHCVKAVLSDLGHTDTTFSGIEHKIMASYFQSLNMQQTFKAYDKAWKSN